MRIIARKTLTEFAAKNPAAAASASHWYHVTLKAQWGSMNDVQQDFPKAKVLNAERVRFEIAGGDFRLIVAFDFRRSIAFVKFVGSHAEYDKIDALTVSMF